jgi:hypothetical protein
MLQVVSVVLTREAHFLARQIGRLEDALNEGMVEPENVAAVLLQVRCCVIPRSNFRDWLGFVPRWAGFETLSATIVCAGSG